MDRFQVWYKNQLAMGQLTAPVHWFNTYIVVDVLTETADPPISPTRANWVRRTVYQDHHLGRCREFAARRNAEV